MAKKQFNTPELNLQAELPQVVSRDFNLFYKPEAEPEIAGLKNFTQSLDNFINGALTTGNILGETKLKEQSEAEATQFFNMEVENKKAFNSAVNKNEIPREANPYFVDKLKELELGAKVQDFKTKFAERYAKENLSENTDPNAFSLIYEEELKKFIKENNIGLYEPTELEKNFFSKTSTFRDAQENMHVNNQLQKIREQFDKNYKIGVQDLFDPDADMESIGKSLSNFIKSATESGMSKNRARELFMESLAEYVEATGDLDFASKLVNELPDYVQLGTDVLGNVNSLKDDFSALEDAIEDRFTQEELDALEKNDIQIKKENQAVVELTNQYDTFTDFKNGKEYSGLNNRQKEEAKTIYENRRVGFGSFNEPTVTNELQTYLDKGEYDEALNYLNANRTNLTQNTWFDYELKIQTGQAVESDPFVGNRQYDGVTNKLQNLIDDINNQYAGVGSEILGDQAVAEFKEDMNLWLASNPLTKFEGNLSERQDAFRAWSNARLQEYITSLSNDYLDDENRTLPKPQFNNPEEDTGGDDIIEDFDTSKLDDFANNVNFPEEQIVRFIPEGLSAVKLRQFKRKYPNAITLAEFMNLDDEEKEKVINDQTTRKENR